MKKEKLIGKTIFLLGGHDLEMQMIKEMLKDREVKDYGLKWGAKLSSYQAVFNDRDTFVCIELIEDCKTPKNYIEIDHHNGKRGLPSSIEQLALLIGVELNREQILAAANDKGYIPALEAMGATPEEIKRIRYKDKKAQGVTEKDEEQADDSIRKFSYKVGNLLVVESETPYFSTITDKLYPFNELLIRHEKNFTYYGKYRGHLEKKFANLIQERIAYTGGADPGFFGVDGDKLERELALNTYNSVLNQLKAMELKSYHIFMFPFTWKESFDVKGIIPTQESSWLNIEKPSGNDAAIEEYNERHYFYEFIHPLLFEKKETPIEIKHFERKECEIGNLKYEIKFLERKEELFKVKTIELSVDRITVDLFSTETGVLTMYVANYNYPGFDHIKKINHFGRRIFPPFLGKVTGVKETKEANELADELKIIGLNGDENNFSEDFTGYGVDNNWKPAKFIINLLSGFNEKFCPVPVIDDRMFTLCWYFNNQMANAIKGPKRVQKFINSDVWHEYLFVDNNFCTCQNDEMKEKLLKEHTYSRWQKYGTLFGITRYSFVAISDETGFSREFGLVHFRTMYAKMVLMALLQRASILKFSYDITSFNDMEDQNEMIANFNKLDTLHKSYTKFINKIYHHEISAQEQAIDLYDLLVKHMRIKQQAKEIKKEIREFFNYVNLKKTEQINKSTRRLSILVALMVIPGFIFNLFNNRFFKDLGGRDTFFERGLHLDSAILLAIIAILGALTSFGLYYYDETKRVIGLKLKGKHYVWVAAVLLLIYILVFQYLIGKTL